jgi:hypothetical protein
VSVLGAAIEPVVLTVAAIGVVGAFWSLAGMRDLYAGIGRGVLDVPDSTPTSGRESVPEALEEARQMLEARSALRVRHGKEPLAVEEELAGIAREYLRVPPDPQGKSAPGPGGDRR